MSSSSTEVSPTQLPTAEIPSPPISPLALVTGPDYISTPRLDSIIEHVKADHTRAHSRSDSVSSIKFQPNSNGFTTSYLKPKRTVRKRERSPPAPSRFQHHVSFDNFAGGETSEKNTISFTLNVKHKGYQRKRRSRTFMVGIDENDYSDIALTWMLEELVDDGDEVICLRVVDKDAKVVSNRNLDRKQYQEEAKELMERIQVRIDDNKAISIVLEFAVGKVTTTFQKMIQLYEPAMLVVGTRGRSLGGFQALMTISNSFSKWCLQYSPIPVVVVRPTEKRTKKKKKRDADPSRQDYIRILKDSGLEIHETESQSKDTYFEETNAPDVEAHAVAAALGLPARFDPTLTPMILDTSRALRKIDSTASDTTYKSSVSPDSRPSSPSMVMKSPKIRQDSMSGQEESSDSDDEGEFEAVPGHMLLRDEHERSEVERRMKLHEMEMDEAAALASVRKLSIGSADSVSSFPMESPPVDGEKIV